MSMLKFIDFTISKVNTLVVLPSIFRFQKILACPDLRDASWPLIKMFDLVRTVEKESLYCIELSSIL